VPTRRDRRRHRWDTSRAARRSSPTPGRPTATTTATGSRSKGRPTHPAPQGAGRPRRHKRRHPPRIANVTKTNAMEY
jgi:hypothetical protein